MKILDDYNLYLEQLLINENVFDFEKNLNSPTDLLKSKSNPFANILYAIEDLVDRPPKCPLKQLKPGNVLFSFITVSKVPELHSAIFVNKKRVVETTITTNVRQTTLEEFIVRNGIGLVKTAIFTLYDKVNNEPFAFDITNLEKEINKTSKVEYDLLHNNCHQLVSRIVLGSDKGVLTSMTLIHALKKHAIEKSEENLKKGDVILKRIAL